ncbi:hypothetical protein AB0D49_01035 [Streptomyces sp. NPDC048290]
MTDENPRTKSLRSDPVFWGGLLMGLVWSSVFAFVMSVVLTHGR